MFTNVLSTYNAITVPTFTKSSINPINQYLIDFIVLTVICVESFFIVLTRYFASLIRFDEI